MYNFGGDYPVEAVERATSIGWVSIPEIWGSHGEGIVAFVDLSSLGRLARLCRWFRSHVAPALLIEQSEVLELGRVEDLAYGEYISGFPSGPGGETYG